MRLTTASEYLANKSIFLRCRIQSAWSLLSRVVLVAATLASFILIDNFAEIQPWFWLTLPMVALMAWFVEDDRQFQSAAAAQIVRDTAEDLKLEFYQPKQAPIAPQPGPETAERAQHASALQA